MHREINPTKNLPLAPIVTSVLKRTLATKESTFIFPPVLTSRKALPCLTWNKNIKKYWRIGYICLQDGYPPAKQELCELMFRMILHNGIGPNVSNPSIILQTNKWKKKSRKTHRSHTFPIFKSQKLKSLSQSDYSVMFWISNSSHKIPQNSVNDL